MHLHQWMRYEIPLTYLLVVFSFPLHILFLLSVKQSTAILTYPEMIALLLGLQNRLSYANLNPMFAFEKLFEPLHRNILPFCKRSYVRTKPFCGSFDTTPHNRASLKTPFPNDENGTDSHNRACPAIVPTSPVLA